MFFPETNLLAPTVARVRAAHALLGYARRSRQRRTATHSLGPARYGLQCAGGLGGHDFGMRSTFFHSASSPSDLPDHAECGAHRVPGAGMDGWSEADILQGYLRRRYSGSGRIPVQMGTSSGG